MSNASYSKLVSSNALDWYLASSWQQDLLILSEQTSCQTWCLLISWPSLADNFLGTCCDDNYNAFAPKGMTTILSPRSCLPFGSCWRVSRQKDFVLLWLQLSGDGGNLFYGDVKSNLISNSRHLWYLQYFASYLLITSNVGMSRRRPNYLEYMWEGVSREDCDRKRSEDIEYCESQLFVLPRTMPYGKPTFT